DAVSAVAARLRTAGTRVREAAGTVAARSRDLADVLDKALHFHERHGDGPCPVCGKSGAMTAAWHEKQAKQARDLRDAAREVDGAQSALSSARSEASRLPVPRADLLERAAALELDVAPARTALDAFLSGLKTEDASDLASHLEHAGPSLLA